MGENRRGRRWRELERTGRKEREGKGRKPEETEEEAEEKRNRTGNGENQNRGRVLSRGDTRGREKEIGTGNGVGNKVERTGRKEGDETEGNTSEQGRRDPWRKLYRTVEKNGENSPGSSGRKVGRNHPHPHPLCRDQWSPYWVL